LKHVWEFQQEQEVRVEHTVRVVRTLTEHDAFLMPLFVQHGYRNNELQLLNQCQCFLQALTVADLLTADSIRVCQDSWLGVRNHSRQQEHTWPRTKRNWALWRHALTAVLVASSHRSTAWILGHWKRDSIPQWNWLLNPTSGELFHLEGSIWVSWLPTGRPVLRSTSRTFLKGHRVSRLPTHLQQVSVRRLSQPPYTFATGLR
jgi:hypothetical protein